MIYVDRLPPRSRVESVKPAPGGVDVEVRSLEGTAERVHVFVDLPAAMSEQAIMNRVKQGEGRLDRVDRDLFRTRLPGVASGDHTLTLTTIEPSGNRNLERVQVTAP